MGVLEQSAVLKSSKTTLPVGVPAPDAPLTFTLSLSRILDATVGLMAETTTLSLGSPQPLGPAAWLLLSPL